MTRSPIRRVAMAVAAATTGLATVVVGGITPAQARDRDQDLDTGPLTYAGTFDVTANGTEVAEILDITADGRTVVYTDSSTGSVGFVDVRNPAAPAAAGAVVVGGSPTSVALAGRLALVATDTSASFVAPSGQLVVVDTRTRAVVATRELGGQPDSVTLSPDGRYAAIVIENQRDEDLDDGLIPQLPSGDLVIVSLTGAPASWPIRRVALTGLADIAPTDAEVEFVDINHRNQAVVTLQENNHIAVVDLVKGRVTADFPAGEVTLERVDATEEAIGPQERGDISFTETITKRREPDTVQWITSSLFATANEGDYTDADGNEGGSRSFTVFDTTGRVVFDSGPEFEYALASAGHYPEGRSENKGVEPEALEYGVIGRTKLLVVGAERANALGVYDVSRPREPQLLQVLPTGIGPEGIKINSRRGLLAVANETAVEGVPSLITLYSARSRGASYPQLVSEVDNDTPIPWVAMSGLAGDIEDAGKLYAVSDSILGNGYAYVLDVTDTPARITQRIPVTDPDGLAGPDGFFPDFEGIAQAPDRGFWLASEGDGETRPNALVKTDDAGVVQFIATLPADLVAGQTSSGFEGVALSPDGAFAYAVIQREWADDPADTVKIARYEIATDEWAFVRYAKAQPAVGWVGLSEISALPNGSFAVIERDNQLGPAAVTKKLYTVDLAGADFRPFGSDLVTVDKSLALDLLPRLDAESVWTPDKLEGFTVADDRRAYAVTDNDGLDDAVGQTLFLRLRKF